MRPVICMITAACGDRDQERALIDRVSAAARAGVHLIQIRQPGVEGRTLFELVERAVRAVKGTPTRVVVNDRVDVAMAAGAHGVHLRGDSLPAARIRAITPPGFVIGRSVHSPEEGARVAQQGHLDYLIFGTVFTTSSKPKVVPAGVEALAALCGEALLPVLAVGGITRPRAGMVARAGAAGFAAIGLFADSPLDEMPAVVREAASAFESR